MTRGIGIMRLLPESARVTYLRGLLAAELRRLECHEGADALALLSYLEHNCRAESYEGMQAEVTQVAARLSARVKDKP